MSTQTRPVSTIDLRDTAPAEAAPGRSGGRLLALDAARGLAIAVMLLAMHPGQNHDLYQLTHPDWHGLTFADLFFPLFLFAIGVSLTLSSRSAEPSHVLKRAAKLLVIGIALSSLKHERFALTGVLQHIAVAYVFAWAILRAPRRWHVPLAAGVVGVVWVAFEFWTWGDDPWGRSGTLAHAVDGALLGGYTSEGVIQSLSSAVLVVGGAVAGHLVREVPDRRELVRKLATRSAWLIGAALVMSVLVPINKRLWTPSYSVITLGTSFAWFALGVRLIDVAGRKRVVAPLIHLGANPIAIYALFMAALALLDNHAGSWFPTITPFGSLTAGSTLYAVAWLILGWSFAYALHRRKILIKI